MHSYGVRADYVPADLSKVKEIEALWLQVTCIYPDGVDILVNNAGEKTANHGIYSYVLIAGVFSGAKKHCFFA